MRVAKLLFILTAGIFLGGVPAWAGTPSCAETAASVSELTVAGIVESVPSVGNDYYVNESLWHTLKVPAKKTVMVVLSRHEACRSGMTSALASVDILGGTSGRKLAKWGTFTGYKFY